jgi:hypothetical protein
VANIEHRRSPSIGCGLYSGRVREYAGCVKQSIYSTLSNWQVDFSMLESYPEVVMSKLHLHHGHTHHHAESVSAAVSCMAK